MTVVCLKPSFLKNIISQICLTYELEVSKYYWVYYGAWAQWRPYRTLWFEGDGGYSEVNLQSFQECLRKHVICVRFLSIRNADTVQVFGTPLTKDNDSFIIHSHQYHGCWWQIQRARLSGTIRHKTSSAPDGLHFLQLRLLNKPKSSTL